MSLERQILEAKLNGGGIAGDASSVVSGTTDTTDTEKEEDPEVKRKRKMREAIRDKLAKQRQANSCWTKVKRYFKAEKAIPLGPEAWDAATKCFLVPSDLRKLKAIFDLLDFDGVGEVEIDQFLDHCDEPYGPFQYGLMKLVGKDCMHLVALDEVVPEEGPKKRKLVIPGEEEEEESKKKPKFKKSDTMTFDEFILILCRYNCYRKDDILDYCFKTFDRDNSGNIDEDEFMKMAMWLQSKQPIFPGNIQRAMEEFDVDDDGQLGYGEFKELWKRYPLLLFPAFRVQNSLQASFLGEEFWKMVHEDRAKDEEIKKWRRTHGGAFPKEPREERFRRVRFGRHNLYSGKPSLPPIEQALKNKKLRDKGKVRRAKKKKTAKTAPEGGAGEA
uniref:EF-hand domain-containing protein n=1 Tax=Bicosoecida sp. CB-2014 TaxID=1486930 RepID=A0A7S1GD06_9STRA